MAEENVEGKVELGGVATRTGGVSAPEAGQVQINLYREDGRHLRALNVPKETTTRYFEFAGRRYERQENAPEGSYLDVGEAKGLDPNKPLTYNGGQPITGFGE